MDLVLNSDVSKSIKTIDKFKSQLTAEKGFLIRHQLDLVNACNETKKVASNNFICRGLCLFDLFNDPCETTDIASQEPLIVESLKSRINEYWPQVVPQKVKFVDPTSDPKFCNGTWWLWKENPPYCPQAI